MLHPAPTNAIDPALARGIVKEIAEPTATKPARVRLAFHNLNYLMDLVPSGPIDAAVGKGIIGVISADARRVDRVTTGGRYVEPVIGRPRRVQGTVIAIDEATGSIVVNAGVPIKCHLTDGRQTPSGFELGEFVSFDVLRGATFQTQR
ncbi:MAG: hypothetical protein CMJ31_06245 [Phycisphaerae bacterium]|nr:hypothetical protein [Phycisphaerae bacterium]